MSLRKKEIHHMFVIHHLVKNQNLVVLEWFDSILWNETVSSVIGWSIGIQLELDPWDLAVVVARQGDQILSYRKLLNWSLTWIVS